MCDLNGDSQYELIFEWEGDNPFLEAIDLDGNSYWRINLGPNVTSNNVPFMVYDLDGDGKAEVACTIGPGTVDGTGRYLRKGAAATVDHSIILERVSRRLVEDPSYVTVFNGETGQAYTERYFYLKTSFIHSLRNTTYQLINAQGIPVFEFGGVNSTSASVWATGAPVTSIRLGKRDQWSDIEVLLDLQEKKSGALCPGK